jgi:DNA polymerase-3 subunit epsilon
MDDYSVVVLDFETTGLSSENESVFLFRITRASRRVNPDAPGDSLETLVRYTDIITDGTFHRALADAEMTALLSIAMTKELKAAYPLRQVSFDLMQRLSKISKASAPAYLARIAEAPYNRLTDSVGKQKQSHLFFV